MCVQIHINNKKQIIVYIHIYICMYISSVLFDKIINPCNRNEMT